jgi:hypothetical protein
MTDDLVKRLRIGIHTSADEQVLRDEAADRIEHLENRCANLLIGNRALNIRSDKLEAALRDVIDNFFDSTRICEIARKALDDAP